METLAAFLSSKVMQMLEKHPGVLPLNSGDFLSDVTEVSVTLSSAFGSTLPAPIDNVAFPQPMPLR